MSQYSKFTYGYCACLENTLTCMVPNDNKGLYYSKHIPYGFSKVKNIIQEPMTQEKATAILEKGKDLFLDEKHLDWKVMTYIRNYVEFLEMDYEGLKREAHDFHQKNLIGSDYLHNYLSELDAAYNQAKLYLDIE